MADYLWSNGDISPSIQIASPGMYTIEVTTPCNEVSQNIEIVSGTDCERIETQREIFIPNVFSPDGDGINNVFSISFGADLQVMGMEGSIFDRRGNHVFSSAEIPFTWHGQVDQEYVEPGVYAYLIRVTYVVDAKEYVKVFPGDIKVIR